MASGAVPVARDLRGATGYSLGSAYVVVTITPGGSVVLLVASAWSHSRALGVVPVARSLTATNISLSRAVDVMPVAEAGGGLCGGRSRDRRA